MKLTETLQVKRSQELSTLCHLAKNLYNLANWYYRQDFIALNNCPSYYDLNFILKEKESYRALPIQTSQQLLKLVARNWKAYFNALREYKVNPFKFRARPNIPNYINADKIASYNTMRKAVPNSILDDGIEGVGLHPMLLEV